LTPEISKQIAGQVFFAEKHLAMGRKRSDFTLKRLNP